MSARHEPMLPWQLVKHTRYCWPLLTAWWLLVGAGLAQEPSRPKIPPPPPLASVIDEDVDILEQLIEDANVFRLWHGCEPMFLSVEGLPDDAADIDLTKERIQTLAESRLRVARLYVGYDDEVLLSSPPLKLPPVLYVRVGVLVSESGRGGAFSIEVSFKKHLRDDVSDRNGSATTWDTTTYGMHGGDAGYIMQAVSERLDWFILEYLRVNETACQ